MHVAPMASIDDGTFEIVSLGAPPKVVFALQSSRIYSGEHLHLPMTQHFRAERITLDLDNEGARDSFLVDLDGDPMGKLPVTIEMIPSALRLRT